MFLKILKSKEKNKMKKTFWLLNEKNLNNSNSKVDLKKILKNYGFIETVGAGIAQVKGLFDVKAGELVKIYPFNILALALNLGENRVGLVLCGSERFVNQNDIVAITGKLISIQINSKILGTVIDPLGFNLMTNQMLSGSDTVTMPVEQGAPDIISRQPIFEPLLTGLTVIDSLVPIGRGQRELIIGDRQTGKHL
jgi:F-type H+-transporting ATPase subunit alpha